MDGTGSNLPNNIGSVLPIDVPSRSAIRIHAKFTLENKLRVMILINKSPFPPSDGNGSLSRTMTLPIPDIYYTDDKINKTRYIHP